ncbi:hypothetical protein NQ318_006878 [Aromia moschata]|uniref:SAM domain-containing protein n=1 Tax=Aromia moschata TaxID=1265417 RepID=A0AAV8YLE6_9CUCU|nr:hypothetical protein NQ318_006878 [Aromia moschata]
MPIGSETRGSKTIACHLHRPLHPCRLPLRRPLPRPPSPPESEKSSQFQRAQSRRQSVRSTVSAEDRMQEELVNVLTLVRERNKERHLDIKQTPESYIDQKSSPNDVRQWLDKKGFSVKIQDKFIGVGGHHLFDFKKPELEAICGKDEGRRLYSQLNIQKAISGYQTVRTTELKAILAKARQKIETD